MKFNPYLSLCTKLTQNGSKPKYEKQKMLEENTGRDFSLSYVWLSSKSPDVWRLSEVTEETREQR